MPRKPPFVALIKSPSYINSPITELGFPLPFSSASAQKPRHRHPDRQPRHYRDILPRQVHHPLEPHQRGRHLRHRPPPFDRTRTLRAGRGPLLRRTVRALRLGSTLAGHAGYVNTVAVSPDGSLCASSGKDGVILLWDLAEGKKLYSLDVGSIIHALCFSPNRYWLCAATESSIKIWDLESKSVVVDLKVDLKQESEMATNGAATTATSKNKASKLLVEDLMACVDLVEVLLVDYPQSSLRVNTSSGMFLRRERDKVIRDIEKRMF